MKGDRQKIIKKLDDVLSDLKDFQKATVASVIKGFQSNKNNNRMLVADEVGLGKTLVAKGVIAELLKEKIVANKSTPLRVTYICSNLTLANENLKKLAIFKGEDRHRYVRSPSYSRLLEVAVSEVKPKKCGKRWLELCSLTPSTSFDLTRGHGNWKERLIIYFSLIEHSELLQYADALSDFLSCGVKGWDKECNDFIDEKKIVPAIVSDFHKRLLQPIDENEKCTCGIDNGSRTALEILLNYLQGLTDPENMHRFRAYLRLLLARSCAKYLSADLFILDEFQRFKTLLATQSETGDSIIANQVFENKQSTKVLLLSATPFKAFSRAEDDENGEAHATELRLLLEFLSHSNAEILNEYEEQRKALQKQLLSLREEDTVLAKLSSSHKRNVENILKRYISRTERNQISESYDKVFGVEFHQCVNDFSVDEIKVFKAFAQLAKAVADKSGLKFTHQVMEFHKSAPWALSFLTGYQLRKKLDKYRSKVSSSIKCSGQGWLSKKSVRNYRLKLSEAPHAKTRALVSKLFQNNEFETSSEELLWVPPSISHYPLEGSFKGQEDFSKTLLFSSWAIAPRALSGLLSYEAERRLIQNHRKKLDYFKSNKPSIRFSERSSLAGWSLIYPSKLMCCELPLIREWVSLKDLVNERVRYFQRKIKTKRLKSYESSHAKSDRWYAYAPLLIDYEYGHSAQVEQWLDCYKTVINRRKKEGRYNKQSSYCRFVDKWNKDRLRLGKMPKGLARYLAYLSIASPSVTTARTLIDLYPDDDFSNIALEAAKVGEATVTLFNKREAELMITKRHHKKKYFEAVLYYAAEGDFQAVIDEYGHLLKGSGHDMEAAAQQLCEVLSLSDISIACQFRERRLNSEFGTKQSKLRCHYALPLGNQKLSDEQGLKRISNVRDAFNSPFYPFVLNSTSIGQEGLDFHWYCLRVVHWNLPGNPIDMEQREGRVNRYKSLLVRKRIAEKYREYSTDVPDGDLWEKVFQWADQQTSEARMSDLIPYWHYPSGAAKIECFIPLKPMSQDVKRLEYSLKLLALYRLSFGQPRQEGLLENLLLREFSEKEIALIKSKLMINLSPICQDLPDHEFTF